MGKVEGGGKDVMENETASDSPTFCIGYSGLPGLSTDSAQIYRAEISIAGQGDTTRTRNTTNNGFFFFTANLEVKKVPAICFLRLEFQRDIKTLPRVCFAGGNKSKISMSFRRA